MLNPMPAFKKPTISSGNYLLEFAEPMRKIRFEQARAEEAFASIANTQSQQTNVPDAADPQLPRIIFQANRKSISVSQLKCQLDFSFENNDLDIATQIKVLEKNSREFHSSAVKSFSVADYKLNALILDIQFSSTSETIDLQRFIYDRFFKSPSIHPIASVQCSLGFKVEDFFVNVSAQVYESRSIGIKMSDGGIPQFVAIHNHDMVLLDQGVSFRLDFNNRPCSERNGYKLGDESTEIFDIFNKFMVTDFHTLTGLSII